MSEDYIQLPPDGTGKKVRAIRRPDNRYEEVTVPFSKDGKVDLASLLSKLESRLPRKIEADDGTGAYKEIHRRNNALRISVDPLIRDYEDFDETATAESTIEIIPAPSTGQKIRLFDVHFASTEDVVTALRFGATGDLMWALPTKGAISKNLINRERDAPEATGLYVYISGAGRVLGSIGYEIVPA